MAGKPGVLQCRFAGVPAPTGLEKGDDVEPHALRIGERKLVFAVVGEAIFIASDALKAPRAKPIVLGASGRSFCAGLAFRFDNFR